MLQQKEQGQAEAPPRRPGVALAEVGVEVAGSLASSSPRESVATSGSRAHSGSRSRGSGRTSPSVPGPGCASTDGEDLIRVRYLSHRSHIVNSEDVCLVGLPRTLTSLLVEHLAARRGHSMQVFSGTGEALRAIVQEGRRFAIILMPLDTYFARAARESGYSGVVFAVAKKECASGAFVHGLDGVLVRLSSRAVSDLVAVLKEVKRGQSFTSLATHKKGTRGFRSWESLGDPLLGLLYEDPAMFV